MATCAMVYIPRLNVCTIICDLANNYPWKASWKREDSLWSISVRMLLACLDLLYLLKLSDCKK